MLTDRFNQALGEVERLHRGQFRKETTIPYIAHLLAVAALVLEHGGDEDQAIAALWHDAIEDRAAEAGGPDALRAHLRDTYGERVLAMVEACTDAETLPKPPWRARKEAHLAHLREVAPEALLVVAADKLHNARSILADRQVIGEAIWDRFNGGREGTCWYLREMSDLLAERSPGTRAANLAAVVDELER